MPKDSRKRSRSKSPASKKSRDRRSPVHERERDRDRRDRDRDRRDRRRSRSRDRRRREDRKRRSKSDSKSPSPGHGGGSGSGGGDKSSTSTAVAASSSSSSSTKSKSRGNSQGPAPRGLNIEGALKFKDEGPLDNEAEQQRLESEMQKRRERIERWRAEKKARDMGLIPGSPAPSGSGAEKKESTPVPKAVKKWNLSDDEEEEEEGGGSGEGKGTKGEKNGDAAGNGVKREVKEESEEEIDPLDAYMMGIQKEVRSIGAKTKTNILKTGVKKAESTTTAAPTKMEVDPPKVKVEAGQSPETKPTPSGETESAARGETPPASGEAKKAKKVVTVITGVAAKKTDIKKKGTLMEQNQDALEYSSEEEDASKSETWV